MTKRPSDDAVQFEAVKVSLRQDKNGYALVLAVHPDDVPDELFKSWIGQRYIVAMVALTEQGEPIPRTTTKPVDKPLTEATKYAAMLCRDPVFQRWMVRFGYSDAATEQDAADGLKRFLQIGSRREIGDRPEVEEKFNGFVESYLKHAER